MAALIDPNKLENLCRMADEIKNSNLYKSKVFLSKSCTKLMKISKVIVNSPKESISQDECIKLRKQLNSIKNEMELLLKEKILIKEVHDRTHFPDVPILRRDIFLDGF